MPEYSQFENSAPVGGKGLYVGAKGSEVQVASSSGALLISGTSLTATAAELNKLDLSANTLSVITTAAATVTAGINSVEINIPSSGAGAIAVADLANHQGGFFIKQIGASTGATTVTATAGTWDGANGVATFNGALESIYVMVDSVGNGTIIENVGTVGLST